MMYLKTGMCLLLLEMVDFTLASRPNKLIRDICDTLQDSDDLELGEYQQWKTICQDLEIDPYIRKQRDTGDSK